MRQWLITILRPAIAAIALAGVAHAGVVTCANDFDLIPANSYMVSGRITLSTSYATGGETFSAANSLSDVAACLCHSFARKPIDVLVEAEKNLAGSARVFEFNATTSKIMGFVTSTGAEVANTTDLSTITLRFMALCS